MGKGTEYEGLDALIEHIQALPCRDRVRIISPRRIAQFVMARDALTRVAEEVDGTLSLETREDEGWGVIRLEAADLGWSRGCYFPSELLLVDNFEIYPLANGSLRMSAMFLDLTEDVGVDVK